MFNRQRLRAVRLSALRFSVGVSSVISIAFIIFSTLNLRAEEAFWNVDDIQRWAYDELEGSVPYCSKASYRWDVPFFDVDLNTDGFTDFLIPIHCYQELPFSKKSNASSTAAWKAFCSQTQTVFYDCTRDLFGASSIRATVPGDRGGNPYTHVTSPPRDLTGDGYPEIWYALNRDDGRIGLDPTVDSELIDRFCGDDPAESGSVFGNDCTYNSKQTMIISNGDGTYRVEALPWEPIDAFALNVFPNHVGYFDVIAEGNYSGARFARYDGTQFTDVTEEYKQYPTYAQLSYGGSYGKSLLIDGQWYYFKNDVHPTNREVDYKNLSSHGFSVWSIEPGRGIFLIDKYVIDAGDLFSFQDKGAPSGSDSETGVVVQGAPIFYPAWHFFYTTTISEAEGAVIIVGTESGTILPSYWGKDKSHQGTFEFCDNDNTPSSTAPDYVCFGPPFQSFQLKHGKLRERELPVFSGGLGNRAVWMRFHDVNADGLLDMLGMTGANPRPVIALNNGEGSFQPIKVGSIWPVINSNAYWDDFDKVEGRGGYSAALYPLTGQGKLSLLYWGAASPVPGYELQDQPPPDAGPVNVLPMAGDISDADLYEVDDQILDLEICVNEGWFNYGLNQETCLLGAVDRLPKTPTGSAIAFQNDMYFLFVTKASNGSKNEEVGGLCSGETDGEVQNYVWRLPLQPVNLFNGTDAVNVRCRAFVANPYGESVKLDATLGVRFDEDLKRPEVAKIITTHGSVAFELSNAPDDNVESTVACTDGYQSIIQNSVGMEITVRGLTPETEYQCWLFFTEGDSISRSLIQPVTTKVAPNPRGRFMDLMRVVFSIRG